MHLVTINEIIVVLPAAKVEASLAKFDLSVTFESLFTLLHETNKGDDTCARTNHNHGNVVSRWHVKVRALNEAHGGQNSVVAGLLELEHVLDVARDEAIANDFTLGWMIHIEAGQRDSDHEFLGVSQAGRCDRVVTRHDEVTLLEDEIGGEAQRWNY